MLCGDVGFVVVGGYYFFDLVVSAKVLLSNVDFFLIFIFELFQSQVNYDAFNLDYIRTFSF